MKCATQRKMLRGLKPGKQKFKGLPVLTTSRTGFGVLSKKMRKQNYLFPHSKKWRRPESNRCPNIFAESFLHVYFGINCREITGAKQTNYFLSWIVLSNRHSLRKQHSVFILMSAAGHGNRPTGPAALMTT